MEKSLNSEDTESHINLETILKNKTKKHKSIIYLSVAKVITVATISRFPGKISVFQNKMELKQREKKILLPDEMTRLD